MAQKGLTFDKINPYTNTQYPYFLLTKCFNVLIPKRKKIKISTPKKLFQKIGDPGWIWDHLRFDSDM